MRGMEGRLDTFSGEVFMKRNAMFLIGSMLVIVFWTGNSFAAQPDAGAGLEGSAPAGPALAATAAGDSSNDEQTRTETGADELADQRFSEMGVIVMTRADMDASKIVKGWHAHVVYALEGGRETANGQIIGRDADGIVVRSGPWERPEIAYAVIETLAVAPDRRTLEKWRRAREAADYVTVMYQADLDPSQIATGWYAYVFFTKDGKESGVTGEIAAVDSSGVTIETAPPVRRRGFARRRSLQIAFEAIEVIVVSEKRDAVEAWPKTSPAAGLETRKRPWCEIGANLLSVFILKGESDDALKMVNVGGGLTRLSPSFYMSSFFTERLAFDFGLAYSYVALGEGSGRSTRVAQGGFSFLGSRSASGSPYGRVFATTLDGDYFNSRFGAGVGVGTRHVLRNTIALRYEVQYVRWFGEEFDQANQIEFLLNVGAIIGGR